MLVQYAKWLIWDAAAGLALLVLFTVFLPVLSHAQDAAALAPSPSPNSQKHYTGGEIKKARQSSSMGLIIRQKEPANLETPFDQVDSFLTPTELFYIRSHFSAPKLDLASYQLRIGGAVTNPFSLSYKELRDMPSETRVATLECAGNGRVFLIPQVEGAQWELGAVGNAEWTGVPLGALLERAGMEEDACEIVLEGADQGTPDIKPKLPLPISYARSLPETKQFSGKY